MASPRSHFLCGDLGLLLDGTDGQPVHHRPVTAGCLSLHSMYFFLSNLCFLDLCSTPQLLVNLPEKTISYSGCMFQLYFVLALGITECVLLLMMSYDRYAAVCRPCTTLCHAHFFCFLLGVASWISGFTASALHSLFTFWVPRVDIAEWTASSVNSQHS